METAKVTQDSHLSAPSSPCPGHGERVTAHQVHGGCHPRHLPHQRDPWPGTLSNQFQVRGGRSVPAEGKKVLLPRCAGTDIQREVWSSGTVKTEDLDVQTSGIFIFAQPGGGL